MQIYQRYYRICAIVFLSIGIAFFIPVIVIMAVNHLTLQDLFRFDTDPQIISFVFALMAIVLIAIGAVFAGVVKSMTARRDALRSGGLRVDAVIDDIRPLYEMAMTTYSTPYVVICRYESNHVTYIYKSGPINYNPASFLTEHKITTLPVYIDRYNPKRYFVDDSMLTENVVIA